MPIPEETPAVLPDYFSEENWEKFIHLFPPEQRAKAPRYSQAAKNLDDMEFHLHELGKSTIRIKVEAEEWKGWVEKNGQVMAFESVGPFAIYKYTQEL